MEFQQKLKGVREFSMMISSVKLHQAEETSKLTSIGKKVHSIFEESKEKVC
jgi:hypothetical protein